MFNKLKRTWTHNDLDYIPNFKQVFPELKHLNSEELCERFCEMNVNFYTEEESPVKLIMRLTLPFAVILMLIMFITLPIKFLITGKWRYDFSGRAIIINWWRSLRIY